MAVTFSKAWSAFVARQTQRPPVMGRWMFEDEDEDDDDPRALRRVP